MTKHILLAIAIVLLLAGLAFAADVTWTAAVNTDFTNVGNWTGGVPAADGDTIDSTTSTAPATNRPAAGTFHFNITNAVSPYISSFLNGAAIGNVTVNSGAGAVVCASAITGNVVITSGQLRPSAAITISGTTDIAAAGTLYFLEYNVMAVGEVTLAGTLDLRGLALDCSVPLRVTASTAAVSWNTGEIFGGFNAAGYSVAHTLTTGADLVCDVAGTLDLGTTTANSIAITTLTAAVTIGNSFACGTLSTGANVAGASKTITVGAGGYTMTNGTLSGTLTVDLSAGAGAYVQTNGTIATGAILNVTTGTGAITYTALTKTGTGAINITMADNANIAWASADASRIDTLTINMGKAATQTATVVFSKLAGPGTLTAGAQRSDWLPSAAGDWDFTGTTTGTHATGFIAKPQTTPLTITNAVNIGSRRFQFSATQSQTLTIPGLTCGNLNVASNHANNTGTLIITGNSSGAAISLGTGTLQYGVLTFGSGFVHRWTGAIAYGGTGTANALNPQGRCIFTGTFTGTGITCTPTSEGAIDCGGFGRVTAVTSTGRRLVVRRAKDASGNPVRLWNGDGCTNVMFKGRKVIGEPGIN